MYLILSIGIFSYIIYFLGLTGHLSGQNIILSTSLALIVLVLVSFKERLWLKSFAKELFTKLTTFEKVVLVLLAIEIVINLVGALGPELSFDALWYHLTLPKIYLQEHQIRYLPGGLYYYSEMPKLIEMLFVPAMYFGGEVLAKVTHFLFGLLTLVLTYLVARRFVPRWASLTAALVFYSNLLVSWLSITAYIDLGRAFFDLAALYYFIEYFDKPKTGNLYSSAISLGFSVASKLIAIVLLPILSLMIFLRFRKFIDVVKFTITAILIPIPWFIHSYISTGNPFYPFFTEYSVSPGIYLENLVTFVHSSDPISPIYIIALPLVIVLFKKFNEKEKFLLLYLVLGFLSWVILPPIGTVRYLVSFLPPLSIVVAIVIVKLNKTYYKKLLLSLIVLVAFITICYRGVANGKYVSVVLGRESKAEFLEENLNFSYGNFYDRDINSKLTDKDRVLIFGGHNLYYADFNFIHSTHVKKGDRFNYILTIDSKLPERFKKDFKLIYENSRTNAKLYTDQEKIWEF